MGIGEIPHPKGEDFRLHRHTLRFTIQDDVQPVFHGRTPKNGYLRKQDEPLSVRSLGSL